MRLPVAASRHFCLGSQTRGLASVASRRLILGIESSCDDSCASVVCSDRTILSSVVLRQDHQDTQGIHPLHAAQAHHRHVPVAIRQALDEAAVRLDDIDGIAVTQGPGMPGCLSVGMAAAKALASVHSKPLVYVHHMHAHALTPLLTEPTPPTFPFLTLLVSGGHTMLVLAHTLYRFQVLANTLDDSIGNSFDKLARELELGWQCASGALVEQLAATHPRGAPLPPLPHIMLGQPSFSFSGLRSASTRLIQAAGGASHLTTSAKAALAQAFQEAAFAPLEDKVVRALSIDPRLRGWRLADSSPVPPTAIHSVVCSGGVASNAYLRERLRHALDIGGRPDVALHFPPVSLCVDNAAMIAWAGHLYWDDRTSDLTPHVVGKWPLDERRRRTSESHAK
ncbi:Similar to S.cerevisiae protein QRI7 (Protein involved in threonylcarbamoyl adenosine biosynthesis) [Malassezia sympodialis ATCC 42132]|uniref:N(6)-L-threonylcarbamoyladenine synthase n=1 Tax=Malassezia sympodialis (strain ATCC 42132) TaxID=1230383 RepID=A0A1M8AC70_MALS4|nr:Similar to S.cerevisiae protein QRI7 (Protein involved in threonylcarbamoyl adenosine biosynthesis) [Malassezia sympodialis ATCC 42132]